MPGSSILNCPMLSDSTRALLVELHDWMCARADIIRYFSTTAHPWWPMLASDYDRLKDRAILISAKLALASNSNIVVEEMLVCLHDWFCRTSECMKYFGHTHPWWNDHEGSRSLRIEHIALLACKQGLLFIDDCRKRGVTYVA